VTRHVAPLALTAQAAPASPSSGRTAVYVESTYGQVQTKTSAGTVRNLQYEHVYNVRDYGATGDGTTNDATAVQAALDLASSTNPGSTVFFPPGTYKVSSELEIKGACTIHLDEGATIIRGVSTMQYILKNFNSSYAPTVYGGRGNITLRGGTIDGGAISFTTSCTSVIFAHADGILVEGVTFQNVVDWHGLELNSVKDGKVRDCTFQGFRLVTTGREISEAVQIDLAINSAALPGIGAGAYDNTACTDILIEGCTVRALGAYGAFGCLTGSHSWADGHKQSNVRVIGNHADGLSNYLVDAANYDNLVVAGNTVINSNGLVRWSLPASMTADLYGLTVTGNVVNNSGVANQAPSVLGYCITLEGQDDGTVANIGAGKYLQGAVISGNTITNVNNTTAAIRALNVLDLVIEGGSMRDVNGTAIGIQLTGNRSAKVVGTKLSDLLGKGIVVEQGASATPATSIGTSIDGVTIEGVTDYGIDTVSWAVSIRNCTLLSPNTSGKALIRISGGSTDNQVVNNLVWRRDGSASANGIEISTSGAAGNKNQLLVGNIVKGFAASTSSAASAVTGTGVWAISGSVTLNPTLATLFSTPTSGAPNNYYTATN
jgi:hypothetical protein